MSSTAKLTVVEALTMFFNSLIRRFNVSVILLATTCGEEVGSFWHDIVV